MAYRFTKTEKWEDAWFSELSPYEKLLFMYLSDKCDIAGFIEVTWKRWSSDTSIPIEEIKGVFQGIKKAIKVSTKGDVVFLTNFLKHQKNLPLSPANKIYEPVMRRFELYMKKFDIQDIDALLDIESEGASEGDARGYSNIIGKGISNGKEGGMGETEIMEAYPFREFWDLYDVRVASIECEKIWRTLSDEDKMRIMEHVPIYKASGTWRVYPRKYLSKKGWKDDVVEFKKDNNGKSGNTGGGKYSLAKLDQALKDTEDK